MKNISRVLILNRENCSSNSSNLSKKMEMKLIYRIMRLNLLIVVIRNRIKNKNRSSILNKKNSFNKNRNNNNNYKISMNNTLNSNNMLKLDLFISFFY